jgi:hypothetical protein
MPWVKSTRSMSVYVFEGGGRGFFFRRITDKTHETLAHNSWMLTYLHHMKNPSAARPI